MQNTRSSILLHDVIVPHNTVEELQVFGNKTPTYSSKLTQTLALLHIWLQVVVIFGWVRLVAFAF